MTILLGVFLVLTLSDALFIRFPTIGATKIAKTRRTPGTRRTRRTPGRNYIKVLEANFLGQEMIQIVKDWLIIVTNTNYNNYVLLRAL